MGDWVWRDGRWVHDPQAPTPVTAADYDPSATRVDIPAVGGRIEYAGAVDYPQPCHGENDEMVEATFNGLRPADTVFPQPPQNPEWVPDGVR